MRQCQKLITLQTILVQFSLVSTNLLALDNMQLKQTLRSLNKSLKSAFEVSFLKMFIFKSFLRVIYLQSFKLECALLHYSDCFMENNHYHLCQCEKSG